MERRQVGKMAETCTCDMQKIDAFRDDLEEEAIQTKRKSDGSRIRIADSFGFRIQFPGECDDCFKVYAKKASESLAWMADENA